MEGTVTEKRRRNGGWRGILGMKISFEISLAMKGRGEEKTNRTREKRGFLER